MKRLMTGFGVAAAFGLVASLSAQTPTTSQSTSDHEVTLTGCLERGTNGNYTLTNARADNSMAGSGSATTTTGTSGTTATGTTTRHRHDDRQRRIRPPAR